VTEVLVVQTQDTPVVVSSSREDLVAQSALEQEVVVVTNEPTVTVSGPIAGSPPYIATRVGQVIFSVDGARFTVEDPITSAEGWLVNSEGVLLVEG
jgi:hypothetical protein